MQEAFDAIFKAWSKESPFMLVNNISVLLDAMNLLVKMHTKTELVGLVEKLKKL